MFLRKPFMALALILALTLPVFAQEGFDPDLDDPTPAGTNTAQSTNTETREEPPPPQSTDTNVSVSTSTGTETREEPPPPIVDRPLPHSEEAPRDLKAYITDGKVPHYIRINVRGHNLRKTPDFTPGKRDNIDFQSKGGDLYAVESIRPMEYGAAVQVHVDKEKRWLYVPYHRKNDFQFCESEACFTALAESLDFFLRGTGVTNEQAVSCGVSAGPEGLILPRGAAQPIREPDPVVRPPVRPPPPSATGPTRLTVKPLWEMAKGAQGAAWTKMLEESLEKNGKGLLSRSSISDARTFCPNYSRLSPEQRKEFFIHLFNGIARYESNFKLGAPAFDEESHQNVYRGRINPRTYSMGLFQMSYTAAPGYRPQCRIDYEKDKRKDVSDPSLTIYDAKIQMDCAVAVMNRWVSEDGGIGYTKDVRQRNGRTRFRGGANYWSTLRNTNPATQNVIASLKRFTPCWR